MPTQDAQQKLAEIMDDSFNENELESLCFDLDLRWDNINRKNLSLTVRELIKHASRHNKITNLVQACREVRPQKDWPQKSEFLPQESTNNGENGHTLSSRNPDKLIFTNRKNELEKLVYSSAPLTQYVVIHAPAGYGKTTLLQELAAHYRAKKWLCGYSQVGKSSTLENITTKLANDLNLTLTASNSYNWGTRFCGAIIQAFQVKSHKELQEGLVLLIDLDGEPSVSLLQDLLVEFIPEIAIGLEQLEARENRTLKFRVLIAGRYLPTIINEEIPSVEIIFEYMPLSFFKFEDIQYAASQYFNKVSYETRDLISGIALSQGGGHPGIMASIFKDIATANIPIKTYLKNLNIWKAHAKKIADGIFSPLQTALHNPDAIYMIALFRYLDLNILEQIIEQHPVESMDDVFDLEYRLLRTYLFTTDGRLIKDSIARKLLVLRFYYSYQQDNKFSSFCHEAQKICKQNIRNDETPPEFWVSEYLYQCLQEHMEQGIDSLAKRSNLRRKIMEVDLPEIIDQLMNHPKTTTIEDPKRNKHKQKRNIKALISHLQSDEQWELQFTLNYYLRREQYSEAPFRELINKISTLAEMYQNPE